MAQGSGGLASAGHWESVLRMCARLGPTFFLAHHLWAGTTEASSSPLLGVRLG